MNIVQQMNSLYYTEKGVKWIVFSKLQIAVNHFSSIKHSYHYKVLLSKIGFTIFYKLV